MSEYSCPCCGEAMAIDEYGGGDPPFCWDCGIYWGDSPAKCDNDDHGPPEVDPDDAEAQRIAEIYADASAEYDHAEEEK